MALRWNGRSWSRKVSPNGHAPNGMSGVAAISPPNACAVGCTTNYPGVQPIAIDHWDGHGWPLVRGRNPGPAPHAVAASSATNVRAVWQSGNRNLALRHC